MPGNFTGISLPSLRSLLCPGSIAAAFLSPAPGSLVHIDLTGTHVAQSPSSDVQIPWRFPTLDNVYADSLEELTIPRRGLAKGSFPFNHPHPRLRKLAIIGEDLADAFSCIVCPGLSVLVVKLSTTTDARRSMVARWQTTHRRYVGIMSPTWLSFGSLDVYTLKPPYPKYGPGH
ncbi:hypothetical protein BDZ89DRAFT_246424 [Hymenopellis radicata]|nr:hypothetical protein BDZ89DRAFT_246424 [Hymenopellis radicata]